MDCIDLSIDEVAAGGDGVGRESSGRVVFVPRSAPGDRLRVRLREQRRDFARAEIDDIVEPSPHRVEPACPYFVGGSCGGCQWQHLSMAEQRRSKRAVVERALRRAVELGLVIEELRAPVADYGWRRRARLHWYRAPSAERAVLGFVAPRSTFVTDIEQCPQLDAELSRALHAVRTRLLRSLHGRGHIHLLAGEEGVHVVIDGAINPSALTRLAAEDGIAGVRLGERREGADTVRVDGLTLAADDFAQASAAGNAALREIVADIAEDWKGKPVLELYAGNGNLSAMLGGAEVLAVDERSRVPVLDGVTWRLAPADLVVRELVAEGREFHAIVLDPPRVGAKDVVAQLAALKASLVVYVSCDPATLGRDLQVLQSTGYRAVRAIPVDLMPQTSHVEVVVVLERDSFQSPK